MSEGCFFSSLPRLTFFLLSRWRCGGACGVSIDGRHEHTFIWLIYLFSHYSWRGPSLSSPYHHLNPPEQKANRKKRKTLNRKPKVVEILWFLRIFLISSISELDWLWWCWFDVFLTLVSYEVAFCDGCAFRQLFVKLNMNYTQCTRSLIRWWNGEKEEEMLVNQKTRNILWAISVSVWCTTKGAFRWHRTHTHKHRTHVTRRAITECGVGITKGPEQTLQQCKQSITKTKPKEKQWKMLSSKGWFAIFSMIMVFFLVTLIFVAVGLS